MPACSSLHRHLIRLASLLAGCAWQQPGRRQLASSASSIIIFFLTAPCSYSLVARSPSKPFTSSTEQLHRQSPAARLYRPAAVSQSPAESRNEKNNIMAAAPAAPRPKSPPASPDPCGRHRLQLAVDALHREIGFLEVPGLLPAILAHTWMLITTAMHTQRPSSSLHRTTYLHAMSLSSPARLMVLAGTPNVLPAPLAAPHFFFFSFCFCFQIWRCIDNCILWINKASQVNEITSRLFQGRRADDELGLELLGASVAIDKTVSFESLV